MITYSVIIPHYSRNGDVSLLSRAVNSIPSRSDIEIIIVDNSPTPLCKTAISDREEVVVVYSDNKRGAGGARNEGLRIAVGKWVLFLDADDFFTPHAFSEFDKHENATDDILYYKSTSCYSDTLEPAQRNNAYCKNIDLFLETHDDYSLRYSYDVPWSKMIRRSLLSANNIVFDEVPKGNDVIFSLLSGAFAKRVAAFQSVVYCVTVTKGSITNTYSLQHLESIFKVNIRRNEILHRLGHKRNGSVAMFILQSVKYGPKVFLKFFITALRTGNLFVGWNRWIKTMLRMKRKASNYTETLS